MIGITLVVVALLCLLLSADNRPYPHCNRQRLERQRKEAWLAKQDEKYIKAMLRKQGWGRSEGMEITAKRTHHPSQGTYSYEGVGISGAFILGSKHKYDLLNPIGQKLRMKNAERRLEEAQAEVLERRQFMEERSYGIDLMGDHRNLGWAEASVDFPDTKEYSTYIIAANNATDWEKGRADKVCSGSNDDVTIQIYLDLLSTNSPGYGTIYLTGGSFDISDTLDVPYGVSIIGAGMGTTAISTKLNWTGSGVKDVIDYNSAEVAAANQRRGNKFSHFTIEGNDTASVTGIRLTYAFHFDIECVCVKNCEADGIEFEACLGVELKGCDIRQNAAQGIHIVDYGGNACTWIKINGCNIERSGSYGIKVGSGEAIFIEECWFENSSGDSGVHMYVEDDSTSTVNVRCTDCSFGAIQSATHSMEIVSGALYLSQCSVYSAASNKDGIRMSGGVLCVNNCRFVCNTSGANGRAVKVTACTLLKLTDNYFDGDVDSGYAVDIDAGSDVVVDSNYFEGGGIYADNYTGRATFNNNILYDIRTTYAIYTLGDYVNVQNNVLADCYYHGIYMDEAYCEVTGNNFFRCGRQTDDTYDAITIASNSGTINSNFIYSNNANKPRYGIQVNGSEIVCIGNYIEGTSTYDIFEGSGKTLNTIALNYCFDETALFRYGAGSIYKDNIGYIAQGEQRYGAGSLTAGNVGDIAFAWANPYAQDILVKKVVVEITTAGGTAGCEIDVGLADDAAGTNLDLSFFDDIDGNAADVNDSWVGGDGGTQTKWIVCEDSASATDAFIVAKILTQNAASLVGKYYIEYVGR